MHGWKRCQVFLAVACGAVAGCGEAPEPPGPVGGPTSNVVGTGNASQMDVLPVRPEPVSSPPAPTAPDAGTGTGESVPDIAVAPSQAPASGRVFAACHESRVSGCDYIHISVQDSSVPLCVQLTLDNCNAYGRGSGLGVDLPLTWQLASGSVSDAKVCDLLDYDPKSLPLNAATGRISWSERGRVISELAIDVTLQVSVEPGSKLPAKIEIDTATPIASIEDCDD
ncbi:MAG TPA: hypothetical protein VJU61_16230 [Polyangiaceae bacterium]|nr:hypothetical protein [Polyangiaceae bacterium]